MTNIGSNMFPFPQFSIVYLFLSILVLLISILLYHSLYTNLLKKYLQNIYYFTKNYQSKHDRQIVYLFLTSVPMILLMGVSLFYNKSLIGIQISMESDEVNLLLVAGYVCWIQESRHTPIRGISMVRDLFFAIAMLGLLMDLFLQKNLLIDMPISMVILYFLYYIFLSHNESFQSFIKKIFGLKQSNEYNSKFLLTSKHTTSNFLQIKNIIQERKQLIQQQLKDYHQILINLEDNEQDQQILKNFAKLFLPIKKAYEIKQKLDNEEIMKQIQQIWSEGSHRSDQEQEQQQTNNNQKQHQNSGELIKSPTYNESTDGIGSYLLKNTYTDDFIIDQKQQTQDLQPYWKLLRYIFYPLYYFSLLEGRLFYLIGYITLGLLVITCFAIANTTHYICYHMKSMGIVSIIIAASLVYPSARYYIKISSHNDYDFSNIFIQSFILKKFIAAVMIILYIQINGTQIYTNKGSIALLIVKEIIFVIYLIFMAVNRFATRFSNFKFFCGLIAIGWFVKILAQNVLNALLQ